jgi:hypothetical protein
MYPQKKLDLRDWESPLKSIQTKTDLALGRSFHQLPPYSPFMSVISPYLRRNLSRQSDAINAIAGALRPLSVSMGYSYICGIPKIGFDVFLHFFSNTNSRSVLRRRQGFPSYSWAGWIGAVEWATRDYGLATKSLWDEWLAKRTWICWYHRSHSGKSIRFGTFQ